MTGNIIVLGFALVGAGEIFRDRLCPWGNARFPAPLIRNWSSVS